MKSETTRKQKLKDTQTKIEASTHKVITAIKIMQQNGQAPFQESYSFQKK